MSVLGKKGFVVGVLCGLVPSLFVLAWMRMEPFEQSHPAARSPSPATSDSLERNPWVESAAVRLTKSEAQGIHLETTRIQRSSIVRNIIVPAAVEELAIAIDPIETHVSGRIERVLVSSVGQLVEKGQPVAFINSPDLTAAAADYKSTVLRKQTSAEISGELLASKQKRLESWGLDSRQIQDIVLKPEIPVHATIYADVSGIVRTQNVSEGRYVSAGEILMTVMAMDAVSFRSDIFESEIAHIVPGLHAVVTSDAIPGLKLDGILTSVETRSDPQAGTTPVHIKVANPGMKLRPGMSGMAVLKVPVGTNVLTVPRTAVIDSGAGKYVYVAMEGGSFRRRAIEVGTAGNIGYPVLKGLVEGDSVVTNGAFLIDSQSRLNIGGEVLPDNTLSLNKLNEGEDLRYRLGFAITPDPPLKGKKNSFRVTVHDPSGGLVKDAQVRVSLTMPAMPSMGMPEMKNTVDLAWSGSDYGGDMSVSMAGQWIVQVEARRDSQLLAQYSTRFSAR